MDKLTVSKSDLMHHRLQAWLREHTCEDISYLGEEDGTHWYQIGEHKVAHDMIEDLSMEEVEEDEDYTP